MTENDSNQDVVDSVKNMVLLSSGTEKFNPEKLKIHCVPDDCEDPLANIEKKEPEFKEIDNPGGWSSFSFRPVYKKETGLSIRGKVNTKAKVLTNHKVLLSSTENEIIVLTDIKADQSFEFSHLNSAVFNSAILPKF